MNQQKPLDDVSRLDIPTASTVSSQPKRQGGTGECACRSEILGS